MAASEELQNLLDAIVDKGRYDWQTFSDEKAQKLGFDDRRQLAARAAAVDDLEVNEFYCSVRYKPVDRVRNVEVGRCCVVTYGPDYGKQIVITDVVDQARVVVMGVDGILSDIKPRSYPIKRLHLTGTRVPGLTQRGHRMKKVKALINGSLEDVRASIMKDRVVKQIAKRQAKVAMSDFDRFKAWCVKKGL